MLRRSGSARLNYSVKIRPQVRAFFDSLGLEQRRAVKSALKGLASEAGEIRALQDDLAGFYRLKIGRVRIIFRYLPGKQIECVYAGERKLVYEIFESELGRILGERAGRYGRRRTRLARPVVNLHHSLAGEPSVE